MGSSFLHRSSAVCHIFYFSSPFPPFWLDFCNERESLFYAPSLPLHIPLPAFAFPHTKKAAPFFLRKKPDFKIFVWENVLIKKCSNNLIFKSKDLSGNPYVFLLLKSTDLREREQMVNEHG